MFRKNGMYFDVNGHNWKYKLHLKLIKKGGYFVNSLNVGFPCKIPKMFDYRSEKITVVMWLRKPQSLIPCH